LLIGRFAPSPTGPLHMGSLVTAVASFLDMKSRGGQWYVRIDNLDPPRESPAAQSDILSALEAHALQGDRPTDFQSNHFTRYHNALSALQPKLFYCTCTRKSLIGKTVYPGTCRANTAPISDAAIRLRADDKTISFDDTFVGPQTARLGKDYGDFIVKRRDGLWAYNFATALDDGHDATHILRGQDLLPTTPQQIYVMQLLKLRIPQYTHIPLLCFPDGNKLSKQAHAPALNISTAAVNLRTALSYLGLQVPRGQAWQAKHWIDWALSEWPQHQLPKQFRFYQPTRRPE